MLEMLNMLLLTMMQESGPFAFASQSCHSFIFGPLLHNGCSCPRVHPALSQVMGVCHETLYSHQEAVSLDAAKHAWPFFIDVHVSQFAAHVSTPLLT